ncbi:MAG TPA: class I SAM-dependent methyltransferase [Lacunisphaera sp.]|nr:class I SAM-dependent methyltransferase [Lacunisphaera sp.]
MNTDEYSNLGRVEREHWYYAGKRELVRRWLERTGILGPDAVLLDCGAGTGLFAEEMRGRCRVRVLDDHAESLAILRTRFAADEIIEGSATSIPFPAPAVDAVTALDVLEHVANDRGAAAELQRVLRPGGIAVVTVPAMMSLWGYWDVALHHHRRYTRAQLRALFPADTWEILHLNYTNVVVFPGVWLVRRCQRWLNPNAASRVEDMVPPAWLNRVLRGVFVQTGLWRGVPFPFGVSLLLVARKRLSS